MHEEILVCQHLEVQGDCTPKRKCSLNSLAMPHNEATLAGEKEEHRSKVGAIRVPFPGVVGCLCL